MVARGNQVACDDVSRADLVAFQVLTPVMAGSLRIRTHMVWINRSG